MSTPATGEPVAEAFQFTEAVAFPPLRSDLKFTEVSMRGRAAYVVKDPVALKYFRWGEREYRLATLLDGRRCGPELLELMRREFPDRPYEEADLTRTINQLLNAGLLQTDGRVARHLFHHRSKQLQEQKKKKRWLTLPGKIVAFKVTLFDPDLLLLRLNRHLGFLWSWPAALVLLAMIVGAGWLVTSDAANFSARMPDILSWGNLVMMWVVLILVKVVHEFGHGLACKHYGGEVHEMGAMFIVFSPFLFCNASDSWMLKEKWKRLVVTFGGIYFELFLAALAAVFWVLTPPGFFNQVAFNVMLVCSVVTIFFNANPLMKFDGYYALSDILEMPNLKERGDRTLVSSAAGLMTGGAGVVRDPLAESMKGTIMIYALASYAWTFFVAYNILQIIGGMLEPAGLDRLAQSAAAVTLFAGILTPPIMVGIHLFKTVRSDDSGRLRKRVLASGLLLVLAVAAVLSLRVPISVRSACVIEAPNRVRVTAATPGFIREVLVKDGDTVEAGAIVAVLDNPPLEAELVSLQLKHQAVALEEAAAIGGSEHAAVSGLRVLKRQLATVEAKAAADVEQLNLRAPVAGTVLGGQLRDRHGQLLRRGDPLCDILPEGHVEAIVALAEHQAGLVRAGQSASFRLHSLPGETFRGEVLSVDVAPMGELPHQALGEQAGGTVPSLLGAGEDPRSPRAYPAQIIYRAVVAIESKGDLLRPGMSGRLKISCGRQSLGAAIWRTITSMIRTDFRL